MELHIIEKEFGTEKQCREYIYKTRWSNGYSCPHCKSTEAWKTSELKYKCQKCGYKASVTAGTIFQDSHIPLPTWFKAIWYISKNTNGITASNLQQLLNLGSNRTALSMLHKIKQAMVCNSLDMLNGTVELVTTDISVHGKKEFVIFAVEKRNRKIGRIRINKIDRNNPLEWVDFVDRSIESNSTIIHRELNLLKLHLYDDYIQARKSESYSFSCTRKVRSILENWLSTNYIDGDLTQCLNEFCIRVNSLKRNYDFYELLNNSIKLKPILEKYKSFGIEI